MPTELPAKRPPIGQFLSMICVALGAGLLVAGSSFDPSFHLDDPQRMASPLISQRDTEFFFALSATLRGFGAAALTLGILGLVLPWLNHLFTNRSAPQRDGPALPG